jgi:hypothetical protein
VALVVLLRGVNVGGHRTFRPSALAEQLKHLDAVNIGAAGTFVIRRPVSRAQLRTELARRLPFDTQVMICDGREIVRLVSHDHFAGQRVRPRHRSLRECPVPTPSLSTGDAHVLSRQGPMAVENTGPGQPVRPRRLPPPDESDRLSRDARSDFRDAGHDAQLEHHPGDLQSAGQ